jgi:hypothetical protein
LLGAACRIERMTEVKRRIKLFAIAIILERSRLTNAPKTLRILACFQGLIMDSSLKKRLNP